VFLTDQLLTNQQAVHRTRNIWHLSRICVDLLVFITQILHHLPEGRGNISLRNAGTRPPDYMNLQSRRPHERSHISFSTPLCWQLTVTALRSGVQARLPVPRRIGNFPPLTPQAHHPRVRRLQSTTAFRVRSTAITILPAPDNEPLSNFAHAVYFRVS
jgi:hypothetical protein